MKRIIFWTTIISGVAAAYLMYRRGEPINSIAAKAVSNPLGSLATELKTAL